jgi:Tfp pilus assembly protein PilO
MVLIEIHKKYLTKAAIVWVACLVLFLLAYAIALRPQHLNEKRLEKTLTEKKQLYESAQKAAQETTRTQLNEQIQQLRDRLHDFVINLEDSANLTFDIGQIANEKKVASFSVKGKENRAASAIPDCNSIGESHMDISFVSGFYQFATFVNALERHKPVLFVNEFTITRSNQSDSVYEVVLDVAAFVKKPRDKETADKASPPVLNAKT